MSKEEFIEHMSAFLYRLDNERARRQLEDALSKYERNEPSTADRKRMDEIAFLKTNIARIDSDIEWRNPTDSTDSDVKAIAEHLTAMGKGDYGLE